MIQRPEVRDEDPVLFPSNERLKTLLELMELHSRKIAEENRVLQRVADSKHRLVGEPQPSLVPDVVRHEVSVPLAAHHRTVNAVYRGISPDIYRASSLACISMTRR